MSRFKRIKNKTSKKSSVSIDEKIIALNKELERTGMLSERMTTSNIYPEVSETPNQDLSDFEAASFGGQGLGLSGADGNIAGGADIGDASGVTDVALSPPHPVTGVRNSAVHVTTGLGDTTPLRPGKTTTRGFSDNPPVYTMGSVLWFYDSDFNNGAGQPAGKWCNLEWSNFEDDSNGKWFFWDTVKEGQFAGVWIVNTDLSQHPCGDITDLIDDLNFPGTGGSLGAAKIPVITQKGLETEPIYPGPIATLFGLGARAFDWLKGKAEDLADKFKDNFESNMDKNDNTPLQNLFDKVKDSLGDLWDYTNKDLQDRWENLSQSVGDFVTDIFDADNAWDYNAKLALNLGLSIISGKPIDIPLSDKAKQDLVNNIDANALADALTINQSTPTTGDEAVNPTGNKSDQVVKGPWGAQGGLNFNYNEETGELEIVSNKTLRTTSGGESVRPDGTFTDIPEPSIEEVQDMATNILDKLVSSLGGQGLADPNPNYSREQMLADMRNYYDSNTISKATTEIAADIMSRSTQAAAGTAIAIRQALQNLEIPTWNDSQGSGWKPFEGQSDVEQVGGAYGHVTSTTTVAFDDLPPAVQEVIRSRTSGNTQTNSYKPRGRVISEATKLGHFEPDVLNVDIKDIRKGIMPEYPKQPPAEMIDGYHQKSPLRPKPLDSEPYVKITKAELIRNHRLKSSEADEMMDTINRLNDYIKKHPEDLIHAQQRYPAHDPRLAELNWKMDQMLNASEEYLEKNYKFNDKLLKRVIDRTKNNIKLTDPKYAQQRYDELRGTNQKKKDDKESKDMKLKLKLKKYLPQYESKSVFKHVNSDDFKRNIK